MKPFHAPVLEKEVLQWLLTPDTRIFFDGTVGLGGHAQAVLGHAENLLHYAACDLDTEHLALTKERLTPWEEKISLHNVNFSSVEQVMAACPVKGGKSFLLDLGLCSRQVDVPEKGFSFAADGPLHMSYSPENDRTAQDILMQVDQQELVRILRTYGEEDAAVKIARRLIAHREQSPITTTGQLRTIIEESVHPVERKKAITRVFQALRIAVNDELWHLEKFLEDVPHILNPGDRVGIITYHSLEDRIVKQTFRRWSRPVTKEGIYSLHEEVSPALGKLLVKQAILPGAEELQANPRARSAKLRIFEKA